MPIISYTQHVLMAVTRQDLQVDGLILAKFQIIWTSFFIWTDRERQLLMQLIA